MLNVRNFAEAVVGLEHELAKSGDRARLPQAKQAIRVLMKERQETLQKAFETVVANIHENQRIAKRAVAKSEVDSSAVYSNDFDYPATPSQASAAATEALQTLGIRRELARRVQAMAPDASAADIENAISLSIVHYEGDQHQTLDQVDAQRASAMREAGDIAWPSDLASPRATADADAYNSAEFGVETSFSGTRDTRIRPSAGAGDSTSFAKSRSRGR